MVGRGQGEGVAWRGLSSTGCKGAVRLLVKLRGNEPICSHSALATDLGPGPNLPSLPWLDLPSPEPVLGFITSANSEKMIVIV